MRGPQLLCRSSKGGALNRISIPERAILLGSVVLVGGVAAALYAPTTGGILVMAGMGISLFGLHKLGRGGRR